MDTLKIALCFLTLLLAQSCSPNAPATSAPASSKEMRPGIEVSSAWIEKVRRYNYHSDSRTLLAELESFIKPDTLDGTSDKPHLDNGVLHPEAPGGRMKPLFVNLDEEPGDELVGLFGYSRRDISLMVFKQIAGRWYLLYSESFDLFNEEQELQLVNNFSANKVFYVRNLYGRGTCNYSDGYQFFKLIRNRVYSCLELVNSASSCGMYSTPNEEVNMHFAFDSWHADEVRVSYTYDYFATIQDKDYNSRDVSLTKGTGGFTCVWDSVKNRYRPVFDSVATRWSTPGLSAEKLTYFSSFDEKDFVNGFQDEIKQTLKTGTAEQKKLLREYLATIKK